MAAGLLSFPMLAALSVGLLIFHVLLQSTLAVRETGKEWNTGPRDTEVKPKSALAGRAKRASANFRETYPGFVVLVLALAIAGDAPWFAYDLVVNGRCLYKENDSDPVTYAEFHELWRGARLSWRD